MSFDLALFPDVLAPYYAPKKILGSGAMGRVFLASDRRSGRLVAIKMLPLVSNEQMRLRLQREAETLSHVRHRNVLRVYAFGETDSGPYVITEYLRGENLAEYVEDPSLTLEVGKLYRAMAQVGEGLDHVHQLGLVHRDIKPGNIFLTNRGRTVLMDFGLVLDPTRSHLTTTGGVVGTMNFMAPEVMKGEKAGFAADWYSWGVTLFLAREGRVPFDRMQVIACLSQESNPTPEFQVAEGAEAEMLRRLLDWEPSSRLQGWEEIQKAIAPFRDLSTC